MKAFPDKLKLGDSLPLDLPYNKCYTEFLKLK